MKWHLVRWGAFGDAIFITPVIKYLKECGHEVVVSVTGRGKAVLENNPHIDELIFTDDNTVHDGNVRRFWDEERKRVNADKYVNFSESLEVSLLKHPLDPDYMKPKAWRIKNGDINAIDRMFEWAGIDPKDIPNESKKPDLHFTQKEINKVEKFFAAYDGAGFHLEPKKKFILLWALSGSGIQKTYPYTMTAMRELLDKYPDLYILTVGDEVCELLELDPCIKGYERLLTYSGKWSIRETFLACKYAQIVIAPETGVIVASGAFDTPKIGMFSSITKNHATKYFKNDFSIEAEGVNCSPCFRYIQMPFQCPMHLTGATMCMGEGFTVNRVIKQIDKVINEYYGGIKCISQKASISHKQVLAQ